MAKYVRVKTNDLKRGYYRYGKSNKYKYKWIKVDKNGVPLDSGVFVNSNNSGGFITTFLGVILIFITFFTLFGSLVGGSGRVFQFSDVMSFVSDAPSIDVSWITKVTDLHQYESWSVFDFLRNFVNLFIDIISFGLFIVTGLGQVIVYVTYVLGYFFVA